VTNTKMLNWYFSTESFIVWSRKQRVTSPGKASINARASVRYPIWTVKQAALFARDNSFHIKLENRRRDAISLNRSICLTQSQLLKNLQICQS